MSTQNKGGHKTTSDIKLLKQAWYTILVSCPAFGAYTTTQYNKSWTGLLAGLLAGIIVSGILYAATKGVLFIVRKLRHNS